MTGHIHELVIIGGGPAGLAAGLYAARDGLDCLLFERGAPGGQMLLSAYVANYPGITGPLSGLELAEKMREHAQRFGLAIRNEAATSLHRDGKGVRVGTQGGGALARTAIIATGCSCRKLGAPGEERLAGRGVSYCGSCDGPLFKGKSVVVVGGGDTAVEEAIFLTRFAREVNVVHRRDRLRANRHLQKHAFANAKIRFLWNSVVDEIMGEESVRAVMLRDLRSGAERPLDCDGVFIFIGADPATGFLKGALELDAGGYVVTNGALRTSIHCVFAAGDVRRDAVKQISCAAGEGVAALIQAERYLEAFG